MGLTLAEKIIQAHLVDGVMTPGHEIGLKIDHTLTQARRCLAQIAIPPIQEGWASSPSVPAAWM